MQYETKCIEAYEKFNKRMIKGSQKIIINWNHLPHNKATTSNVSSLKLSFVWSTFFLCIINRF